MAANPNKISTFNVPDDGKVVDSAWRDDIDVAYAKEDNIIPFEVYGKNDKAERETFIDPDKVVSKDAQRKIDRIKAKKIGLKIKNVLELQAA